jgi:hypothetical protein
MKNSKETTTQTFFLIIGLVLLAIILTALDAKYNHIII